MTDPHRTPSPRDDGALVMVASFPDELGAMLCVTDLEGAGVPAVSSGALTSQWRADAPGFVKVLVRATDESRARAILHERSVHPMSDVELEDQSAQWAADEDD